MANGERMRKLTTPFNPFIILLMCYIYIIFQAKYLDYVYMKRNVEKGIQVKRYKKKARRRRERKREQTGGGRGKKKDTHIHKHLHDFPFRWCWCAQINKRIRRRLSMTYKIKQPKAGGVAFQCTTTKANHK